MSQNKFIVRKADNIHDLCDSVYMRVGPGDRNLVRVAVCTCGRNTARKLARVLNAVHADLKSEALYTPATLALKELEEGL